MGLSTGLRGPLLRAFFRGVSLPAASSSPFGLRLGHVKPPQLPLCVSAVAFVQLPPSFWLVLVLSQKACYGFLLICAQILSNFMKLNVKSSKRKGLKS